MLYYIIRFNLILPFPSQFCVLEMKKIVIFPFVYWLNNQF